MRAKVRCIAVTLAVVAVLAGCVDRPIVSPTPPVGGPTPAPSALTGPAPTSNACAAPLRAVAQASQLMADKLVSLRKPLLAGSYDGWQMLGLARGTNATLKLYANTIPELADCPQAGELGERLAEVATSARRQIAIVIRSGIAVAPAPRQAMVGLFELLPEVVAISEDATAIAEQVSVELAVATVPEGSMEPLGELAPLPEPDATPRPPRTAGIRAEFFGSGVTLETYRVTGTTPFEISASMNQSGPYSEWTQSRVDGLTTARVDYRFQLAGNGAGGCVISATASPAIVITYTVTLPRWSEPSSASSATVEWWNSLVREIATHEKHHIVIYRDAQRDLNQALLQSTCENAEAKLLKVWSQANLEQCEFDMEEYGYAIGLTLEDCVAQ
jgi:predicted secreted Zn-dependent protease